MTRTETRLPGSLPQLTARAAEDPWSLSIEDRVRLAASTIASASRNRWGDRLAALVEPPAPVIESFPFWLLDNPYSGSLRDAVGDADVRADLTTATADQLQRFVDLFRDYTTELDPPQR